MDDREYNTDSDGDDNDEEQHEDVQNNGEETEAPPPPQQNESRNRSARSEESSSHDILSMERKGVLLLVKMGGLVPSIRKSYTMRYFWYNPYDPDYLRYSKDKDMRFVHVIPIKTSKMTFKSNRDSPKANTLIHNCHRKHKVKFIDGKNVFTLYFQSKRDFDDWLLLFESIRNDHVEGNRNINGNHGSRTHFNGNNKGMVQENWYESKYGSNKLNTSSSSTSSIPPSPGTSPSVKSLAAGRRSPVLTRRPPVMIICELPDSLGFMRLNLEHLDWQVITVNRFKERLFEALHLHLHSSANILIANNFGDDEKKDDKYHSKNCSICKGSRRFIMSRQMFHQELCLDQGPDYYAFEVGHVFPTKAYVPPKPAEMDIRNELFLRPGGLYQSQMQSSEDDLLLKTFEFVPSPLGSTGTSKSDRRKESSEWVEDETIALSTLVERLSPIRPSNVSLMTDETNQVASTNVIHLVLRPTRELPLSRFFISITRYIREYDAITSFTMYVATVRHGGLKWEIRRRFGDFKELDSSLKDYHKRERLQIANNAIGAQSNQQAGGNGNGIQKPLPKLPKEARRTIRTTKGNDEYRVMSELNTYLREAITDRVWDPPPAFLLSFLGLLATGKNSLMQMDETKKRLLCHMDALNDLAEFGDIILFRSVNPLAGLQRVVTGRCTFDHIGIVVKRNRDGYDLLEATGEGVTAYPLLQRLEAYSHGFCDLIALRKVRFNRSAENLNILTEFANQVEGKPYRLTFVALARSRLRSNSSSASLNQGGLQPDKRKSAYFCSELVAEGLRKLNVMTSEGRPDSYFLPHFFDEGGVAEKYLMDGCSLDDVLFIDCKNPEIKFSESHRMGSSAAPM